MSTLFVRVIGKNKGLSARGSVQSKLQKHFVPDGNDAVEAEPELIPDGVHLAAKVGRCVVVERMNFVAESDYLLTHLRKLIGDVRHPGGIHDGTVRLME